MEKMTRNEILTTFDENWFYNDSLPYLENTLLVVGNDANRIGERFLTHKKQKEVKKSIKSILRNANRNKYVSTKDLKVVLDFAELCDAYIGEMGVLPDASNHLTQQQIDFLEETIEELLRNLFQVKLYLSAKLYPNVKTYIIYFNDKIKPAVSNSTVSIHV